MLHLTLASTIAIAKVRKKAEMFFGLSMLILFVFAAIRYDFGNDYMSYSKAYNRIQNGADVFENEALYTLLNKILPDFKILVAITSAITIFPVYKMAKSWVPEQYLWLSVFVYVVNPYIFLMSLSAIRQSLATSFFIWALYFSHKRKLLPYIALVLIASSFHISAIILLPIYLIANERKVNRLQILLIIIVISALLLSNELFDNLISRAMEIFKNEQYDSYINDLSNSVRATVLTSLYLVYVLININKLEGPQLMCAKLYSIGLICGILAFNIAMMTRIQMYFDVFSVVAIPSIICVNYQNKKVNTLPKVLNIYVMPIVLVIIYFLRYYSFFTNDLWEKFFEYQTIWSFL